MEALEGKVALVMGGSRGMGKQMAIELARHGADVAVAARTARCPDSDLPGSTLETAEAIRTLGRRADPIKVDLADPTDIDTMVGRAIELFTHIDILVHSVQYHGHGMYDSFLETTVEELEQQMVVNAMSAVRALQTAGAPHDRTGRRNHRPGDFERRPGRPGKAAGCRCARAWLRHLESCRLSAGDRVGQRGQGRWHSGYRTQSRLRGQ